MSARQHRLRMLGEEYATKGGHGYDVARFWRDRYNTYGPGRAGGNLGLTPEADTAERENGMKVLHDILLALPLPSVPFIVDFGCGGGYQMRAAEMAFPCAQVEGYDIAHKANDRVQLADLTRDILQPGKRTADVVMALDVTQHIVTEPEFEHFLANVVYMLGRIGFFVCTDLLRDTRLSFYEQGRTLEAYIYTFNQLCGRPPAVQMMPMPYRDKHIFVLEVSQ